MTRRYTKADLQDIVYTQLENLDAMHDLLAIMKHQNDLIQNINKKLKEKVMPPIKQPVIYPTGRKRKL